MSYDEFRFDTHGKLEASHKYHFSVFSTNQIGLFVQRLDSFMFFFCRDNTPLQTQLLNW